eukprot:359899-Hanusia_phi.AAC.1
MPSFRPPTPRLAKLINRMAFPSSLSRHHLSNFSMLLPRTLQLAPRRIPSPSATVHMTLSLILPFPPRPQEDIHLNTPILLFFSNVHSSSTSFPSRPVSSLPPPSSHRASASFSPFRPVPHGERGIQPLQN